MKVYQNVLLTIISVCLIVLTLCALGIINKPISVNISTASDDVPVSINNIQFNRHQRISSIPVTVDE
jgi:hypothetical protein